MKEGTNTTKIQKKKETLTKKKCISESYRHRNVSKSTTICCVKKEM